MHVSAEAKCRRAAAFGRSLI
eukprot:COSAG02_NODE_48911_length_330_cov_1.294372_1_plen_20_part_01